VTDLAGILSDLGKHWWLYASMPLIAATIGYVTKLVAVEMMFQPIEFKGRRPYLGWQGIIPRFAGRMAAIACDTLTAKLLSPQDLFDRLDPARMVRELERPLTDAIEKITEEVAARTQPELWNSLPTRAKKQVMRQVRGEAPRVISEIMAQIRDNVESVFDFKEMVVTSLVQDKVTLNKMFREAGKREFQFIVRFGAPSGFAIGLIQAIAWALFKEPWIMPLFGVFTGWLTDYVALKLVFVPKYPTRILGLVRLQGLFYKYREEFTDLYGDLIARQVLTPRNMIQAVLRGPSSDRLFAIIQGTLRDEVDQQVGLSRPLVVLAVGGSGYQQVKEVVAEQTLAQLPDTVMALEDYAEDALDIRNTVVTKMRQLSADEFENLLRPAFKQDEWKLIAVGAVLGGLVGELQTVLVELFGH
jgi:uncharacterized membrane protein YheB (UPF0754 family)